MEKFIVVVTNAEKIILSTPWRNNLTELIWKNDQMCLRKTTFGRLSVFVINIRDGIMPPKSFMPLKISQICR